MVLREKKNQLGGGGKFLLRKGQKSPKARASPNKKTKKGKPSIRGVECIWGERSAEGGEGMNQNS